MRIPKVSDIAGIINKKYPFCLAEDWDNVGIQLGDPSAEVRRLMVALDPLPDVIEHAVTSGCQLLVTHHPLIFKPVRQITSSTGTGRLILRALSSALSTIAMHTNYDIAEAGLNDILAEHLGLSSLLPLQISGRHNLSKLVVFVPSDAMPDLRQAMFEFAESMGNYSCCSFTTGGEGTFLPGDGATPFIGTQGTLEKVREERLELLVRRDRTGAAIKRLLKVHPYEEPAFDCYPLDNEGRAYGIGRIGRLSTPFSLADFASSVKSALGCDHLRVVGDLNRIISKVAICSGSGGSMIRDAVRCGADLLVTGDVRYHDAREAQAAGLDIIDAGHFATERIMVSAVSDFLMREAASAGFELQVLSAEMEKDPFVCLAE